MSLKEFCKTLQQCAERIIEDLRQNINECNNLFFGNRMDETRKALEKAKDYHYNEIVLAIEELLVIVKRIKFHQDKIEWLNDDNNFTLSDLRRFSYVQRQVYNFSQTENKQEMSKSEQNLSALPVIKREKRRTVSEVSIGTLEAWEKYLDKKESNENEVTKNVEEVKKKVQKRTLSNARARKKFVSSTMGGFLDDNTSRRKNLESILENSYHDEEGESCDDIENIHQDTFLTDKSLSQSKKAYTDETKESISKDIDENCKTSLDTSVKISQGVEDNILVNQHVILEENKSGNQNQEKYTDVKDIKIENTFSNKNTDIPLTKVSKNPDQNMFHKIESHELTNEDLLHKIEQEFSSDEFSEKIPTGTKHSDFRNVEKFKPKIVGEILKKKPP